MYSAARAVHGCIATLNGGKPAERHAFAVGGAEKSRMDLFSAATESIYSRPSSGRHFRERM